MSFVQSIRICLFLIFVFFQMLVIGPLLLLTHTVETSIHCIEKKMIYYFYLFILNSKINISFMKKIDKNRKYIIMSNHHTGLDYFILNYVFPNSFTIVKSDIISQRAKKNISLKLIQYVKYLFFKIGMLITYIRNDKASGTETKKNIIKTLEFANILIFPEGTSTRRGIPKEFKKGIFYLAYEHNISIIPCSLKYSKEIGIIPNGKLDLKEWVDNEINLKVHNTIDPNNFKDPLEMMNFTFEKIVNNLY